MNGARATGFEPLVSVLIPVYNVAAFVRAAIGSITAQTHRELEIIVVDDASTDGTRAIVEELARADSRIVLLCNERNRRIVYSLNRALSVARGRYVARMDGDDLAHPERIARQLALLESDPEIALVGVDTCSIDEHGVEFARNRFLSDQRAIARCLTLTTLVSHNWLCRREVYDQLSGYRDVAPVEDYDFLLRLYAAGFRFTNLPFYGMQIRFRQGNTHSTAGIEQIRAFEYVTRLYKERLRTGSDSFSRAAFERATRAGPMVRALHSRSVAFLQRSFEARSRGARVATFLFAAASAIASPAQLRVIWRRRLMRLRARQSLANAGSSEEVTPVVDDAAPGGTP